jgi:ABC-2 type transport system ATP-binding protein
MTRQPSASETLSVVTISGLFHRFANGKRPVLDGIETEVQAGKITGLVGPDGAGKTTLIRIIAGLLIPSKGTVKVLNYDPVREAEQIHMRCGYMPQRFGLYEDLSVIQNLSLWRAR